MHSRTSFFLVRELVPSWSQLYSVRETWSHVTEIKRSHWSPGYVYKYSCIYVCRPIKYKWSGLGGKLKWTHVHRFRFLTFLLSSSAITIKKTAKASSSESSDAMFLM